jgi:hypothetical protein
MRSFLYFFPLAHGTSLLDFLTTNLVPEDMRFQLLNLQWNMRGVEAGRHGVMKVELGTMMPGKADLGISGPSIVGGCGLWKGRLGDNQTFPITAFFLSLPFTTHMSILSL